MLTNEEARAILEEVKTIDVSMYQYNPAYLEDLEMAIAARKQPTDGIYITHKVYSDLCLRAAKAGDLERELAEKKAEPCENAVDRDTIIREMEKRHKDGDAITLGYIKNLPPVTPKQRTGKWIEFRHEEWANNIYIKCSECGKIYHRDEKEFNFCPNCGAKMEGA